MPTKGDPEAMSAGWAGWHEKRPKPARADEHHFDVTIPAGKDDHHEVPLIQRRRANGNSKPMRFRSLHHHSTFSYKDGFQLPAAHVRRAEELMMDSFALTEHGNVSSHVKFEKAAAGTGVKPIFGCEIYMEARDEPSALKNHLTVLARDQIGYQNLLQLVSKSYGESYYYEPTVTKRQLFEHREGLVILSGCSGSALFCAVAGGKGIEPGDAGYARGLEIARRFKRAFGASYFIEVQAFPELENTRRANPILARIGRKLGIQLVGSKDVHYTYVDESEMQMILHNIRGGGRKTLEEQAREWGYDVPLAPPPDDKSMYRLLRATGLSKGEAIEAIVNTELIAMDCKVELPKLEMVRFPVPHRDGQTAQEVWESWLKRGWRERGFHHLPPAERERARRQLAHEKKIIEDKGFIDYMLIVTDAIMYIKNQDIPVWLRGSAAASVVCFLLGICDINPLLYPMLVFERFIDVTREDLPDIDADFPSEARPMLREYLVLKYGSACVSNIGTFQYFKPKLALEDTARVFQVPKFKIERIKDFLIERSSGDLRADSGIEDSIEQFSQVREVFDEHPELYKSKALEGNVKTHGVHAAGLVISNDDIRKVSSVLTREMPKNSGNWVEVLGVDKYDAEYLGMVKMDFLGLATMSMLWSALKDLDMTPTDLLNLPLDDRKVLDGFRANDVVGIFQFDGRACRYVCGAVKPDSFTEVCDITALARPGALHNGAARDYAEIKHGRQIALPIHPAVDPILEPTKFQIVYQEQILRIVTEVGGFHYTKAAEIRRIIAKKHGDQAFNRRRKAFMDGALSVHERSDVPPMEFAIADALWREMITAGSYGFNAAHAYMYGLLGYRLMWLKVYHPDIFYAYALAHLPVSKTHDILRDAAKHGIRLLPPDPVMSARSWQPVRPDGAPKRRPTIRAGFVQVEGIGDKTADTVIAYRDEQGLEDWGSLINVKGIGAKTIEKIEAFVAQDDPFDAFSLDKNIAKIKKLIEKGKLPGLPVPTHSAIDLGESSGSIAVCWLGTILKRNIRDIFEQNRARGQELDPKSIKDPHLNEWAMLTCEDESDQILVTFDRWRYPRNKTKIFDFRMGHDLLLVEAIKPGRATVRKLNVRRAWVIDPDD